MTVRALLHSVVTTIGAGGPPPHSDFAPGMRFGRDSRFELVNGGVTVTAVFLAVRIRILAAHVALQDLAALERVRRRLRDPVGQRVVRVRRGRAGMHGVR